jgi:VWFA-related protein
VLGTKDSASKLVFCLAFCLSAFPPLPLSSTAAGPRVLPGTTSVAKARHLTSQDIIRFQKPIEHNVAVTLKLVQVYVSDKKGKAVTDLRKEDFKVTDNGSPVTITEFEKHALQPPAGPQNLLDKLAPPVRTMTRKFFLFFDFAFNNQRGIKKSKEAARHFIERELKPGDEVGLLSYSTLGGLAIQEFLTIDHRKVRDAVDALSVKRLAGRAGDIEEQYWRQATEGTPPKSSLNDPEMVYSNPKIPPVYNWRRQESKSVSENFILKLTSLAEALRYVPGQKHIVLFTTGVASSLIYGNQEGDPAESVLIGRNSRSKFDTGDHILRTQNEELLKQLSAANCTVFAFDTRESAVVPSLFTYDEQTFEERYRDVFYDEGVRQQVTNPLKDDKITGQYSLRRMSAVTGGKYFSNIGDYEKTLDQVQELTGTYYILGYSVSERTDGEYHALKVEVDRKGCDVRAQAGYFNPKPYAEYSDLEKQLQLYDLALSERSFLRTPLSFSMSALAFVVDEEIRLQVLSKIPNQVMEKFSGKRSELVALIFDDKDNILGLQRYEANLSKYKGMDVFYTSGAAVPPGGYKARLVIRDMENGSAAVASALVNVPPKTFIGLSLQSPILLLAESNFAYLESVPAKKAGKSDWKDAYPFDRAKYSPLLGGLPRNTSRIFALLPCSTAGLVQPEIAVTAWLIDAATGDKVPITVRLVDKTERGNAETLFLELGLTDVPEGKYRLYFHAQDATSRSIAFAQTTLIINP